MGNRRNHFVAESADTAPAMFQCLVDVGVSVAGCHVREGETFITDPADVVELEAKGFVVRVQIDAPSAPTPQPDSDLIITPESTE